MIKRNVPAPVNNQGFLEAIKGQYARIVSDDQERVFHSHGHTVEEIFHLRYSSPFFFLLLFFFYCL